MFRSRKIAQVAFVHEVYLIIKGQVLRFFQIHFAGSFLKIIWSFLIPLLTGFMIYFVFNLLLGIFSVERLLGGLSGYLMFSFLSASLGQSISLLPDQRQSYKQLGKNRRFFIISFCLFRAVMFLPGFIFCLLLAGIHKPSVFLSFPLLLVLFLCFILFVAGIAHYLGVLGTFYPDLRHAMETILVFLFWMSPVFYRFKDIPDPWNSILFLNPFAYFLDLVRTCLGLGADFYLMLSATIVLGLTLFIFTGGWLYHEKHTRELVRYL